MDNKSTSTFHTTIVIFIIVGLVFCMLFTFLLLNRAAKNRNNQTQETIIKYGFANIEVTDEDDAFKVVESVNKKINVEKPRKELKLQTKKKEKDKTVYVMQQYYNNVPVYKHGVNLYVNKKNKTEHIENNYCKFKKSISTKETMSSKQAKQKVLSSYPKYSIKREPKLIIYVESNKKQTVSWLVVVSIKSSDICKTAVVEMYDDNKEKILLLDDTPEEEQQSYEWVVEPTIEADDIITANEQTQWDHVNDDMQVGYGGSDTSRAALLYKDGNYSFVKYDGKSIPVDQATGYSYSPDIHKFILWDDNDCMYKLTPYYSVSSDSDPRGMGSVLQNFYWDEDTMESYYSYGDAGPSKFDTPDNVTCPVKKGTIEMSEVFGEHIEEIPSSKYAIYSNGELITDFDIDYAYMLTQEITTVKERYVIPYKRSGKWGYYNSDGEEILPCEYDACFQSTEREEITDIERVPYLDSEGYLCVQNEDGAGYVDLDGNIVIPLDEFEETRPVFNGLAWAKKDGKWGVIRIIEE